MISFTILNSFKKEALGDVRLLISPKKKTLAAATLRAAAARRRQLQAQASEPAAVEAEPPSQPRRVCSRRPNHPPSRVCRRTDQAEPPHAALASVPPTSSRLTRAVSCPTPPADLPPSASRRSQATSRVAPRSEPHRRALAVGAAKPVARPRHLPKTRPAPSSGTRPAPACIRV